MRTAAVLAALERCGEVQLVVATDQPSEEARAWLARRGATLWATAPESAAGRALRIVRAAASGRSIPAARLAGGRLSQSLADTVARSRPDLVVLGDTFIGEAAPALRALVPRLVIDTMNIESMLWSDVAGLERSPVSRAGYLLLSRNTAALERRVLPAADRVWAPGAEDADWYRGHLGLASVDVVPNAVAERPALATDGDGRSVLLSGLFAYPPNEDAALMLIAISRELARRGVEHRVLLVGRSPGRRMLDAARGLEQVTITGAVESIAPWMERAAVVAVPLRAGSGTKFKLLEAMLSGRADRRGDDGARGLGLEHGRHALVCDEDGFADGISTLLADPALRRRLASAAREQVLRCFCQRSLDEAVAASLALLFGG